MNRRLVIEINFIDKFDLYIYLYSIPDQRITTTEKLLIDIYSIKIEQSKFKCVWLERQQQRRAIGKWFGQKFPKKKKLDVVLMEINGYIMIVVCAACVG